MSINERHLAAFAADHNVFGSPVSPCYLAGRGDPRHVTHALWAAGWTTASDPLHPAIRMTSPDHSLRLDINFADRRSGWRVSPEFGHSYWSASFSTDTPVEIVAGLTDALIQPEPDTAASPVSDLLTARGWQHTTDEAGTQTLLSPDGTVQAELRVSPSIGVIGWQFTAAYRHGEYGPEGLVWRADFHENTPPHLLTAVTAAVCRTDPVLRARFDHVSSHYVSVDAEFAIGDAMVAAHKQRLALARRHRPRPPKPNPGVAGPAPAARTTAAGPAR
ncbi:DUF317 domain-containing protein [Streptomyces bambusae]|uniref:DUF317 domain-containing protein n=1 Tax=Streptomyces bambusae TaxID=1550616 RepID=UPI001CFC57B7|nr:DUF317 domain-containing protein [Streptomyces bambusae]MCB5163659.1 DUF317 domain-containing protein [Streptomyces bambusae]